MPGRGMQLRVEKLEAVLAGVNPDLQEVCGFGDGWIELAVPHTCSSAHELDLPGLEDTFVTEAIAMRQSAFQDIAENFGIPVAMLGKTATSRDNVVIDHSQASEADVRGIVVIRKTEGVATAKPNVIGKTPFRRAAHDEVRSFDRSDQMFRLLTNKFYNVTPKHFI